MNPQRNVQLNGFLIEMLIIWMIRWFDRWSDDEKPSYKFQFLDCPFKLGEHNLWVGGWKKSYSNKSVRPLTHSHRQLIVKEPGSLSSHPALRFVSSRAGSCERSVRALILEADDGRNGDPRLDVHLRLAGAETRHGRARDRDLRGT